MHTTASDGRLTPAALVARVHAAGLTTISVTDHDTVAAIADVTPLAAALNIRVVPGETDPGLPGYGTVDLSISRALGPNVEVYVAGQNLFNQEYVVSTLPTTIGSPRLVNAGVRIRFSGR